MSSYKVSTSENEALELGAPETVKSVLQAIKIILTTPKGTIPMYRDFGVNMDILDMPIPAMEQRARMEYKEAIEQWEPRAQVKDITFSRDIVSGKSIATVEVEIVE